jgi:cell division septation protein DedD
MPVTKNVETPQQREVITPAIPEKTQELVQSSRVEPKRKEVTAGATDNGYVIQLVTYSSDANATEEIGRLKADGCNGFVLKSGKFFVVCSGVYCSKTIAAQKLDHFKKRYKDCFVRFFERT